MWSIILKHCPTDINSCHNHVLQEPANASGGSFAAPDHQYPAYLEIKLTATDSGGLQNSVSTLIYPRTANLSFNSSPSGLQLSVNGVTSAAPFTRAVIANCVHNSIGAPPSQIANGATYEFVSWSDGGAATHDVAASGPATYTANYVDTIPVAPTNLTANATSGLQINLVWADNSSNENGFTLERCAGTSCTTFNVPANVRTYQDKGLSPKTTYRYRVRAYHNAYTSAYSNSVSEKTRPR